MICRCVLDDEKTWKLISSCVEMKNKKLKDKLTIGVFSSSSPISATVPIRYKRGKEYLQSKSIDVVDGDLYEIFIFPFVGNSIIWNL